MKRRRLTPADFPGPKEPLWVQLLLQLLEDESLTETAWEVIRRKGWVPTPALLFAVKALAKEREDEIARRRRKVSR